jgi:hypothetical protein
MRIIPAHPPFLSFRFKHRVFIFSSKWPSTVAKRLARHFIFERSRVLTPVPPDQMWVFFRGFPTPSYRGMSHITDKANAGSVSTSQYLPPSFRTHPHRTHPESSRQCGWKGSGKPQQPATLRGGMKDVSFLFFPQSGVEESIVNAPRITDHRSAV